MALTPEVFYGRASEFAIASNHAMRASDGRLQSFDASAGGLEVALPDATGLDGGDRFFVRNDGSTNAWELTDADGGTLAASVAAGEMASCWLADGSTSAGVWAVEVSSTTAAANAVPSVMLTIAGSLTDTDSAYRWDHQLEVWTQLTDAPTPHQNAGSLSLGGVGLWGGHTSGTQDAVETLTGGVWTSRTASPIDLRFWSGTDVGGTGYHFGNDPAASSDDVARSYVIDTWTTLTSMPTGRHSCSSETLSSDFAHVIGGRSGSAFLRTHERYDTVGDSWITRRSFPGEELQRIGVFVVDGKMHKVGGDPGGTDVDDVAFYDPVTNSWTSRIAFPAGVRAGLGCTAPEGIGHGAGGSENNMSLDDLRRYNHVIDSWTQKTDIPVEKNLIHQQTRSVTP